MTAEIVNLEGWKYTKIAKEFVEIRAKDPIAAATFARQKVRPEDFKTLSKYIELELVRVGEFEPREGQKDE